MKINPGADIPPTIIGGYMPKDNDRYPAKKNLMEIFVLFTIAAIFSSGCSSSGEQQVNSRKSDSYKGLGLDSPEGQLQRLEKELDEQSIEVADPLEGINRIMFGFNEITEDWLLRPVTDIYTAITPKPARTGVRNFFNNLGTPLRFVSCHLQGKVDEADIELNRFLINSTVGILGFGDPAGDQHGLKPPPREDLGQALGTAGMDEGLYLVWPLFGPSTLRDSIGIAGGVFLSPIHYVEPCETAMSIRAVKGVNIMSFKLGQYENIKSTAIDPYIAIREVYIQYRRKQIEQ